MTDDTLDVLDSLDDAAWAGGGTVAAYPAVSAWLRFSLFEMLIGVAVLGWIVWNVVIEHDQSARIRRLEAWTDYDGSVE